ncbi:hypothetical protein [Amycolatopsis sp. NPDC051903]|uniref:hypothetical protein n=1 Tax=Amycolatopsis sp. NPDC051903 TaxID=3363936 RepID=UPI003798228B
MPKRPTRADTTQWLVWHAAELAAIAVPLVLGCLLAGWLVFASAAVAAAWGVHELTTRRRTRGELTTATAPRQIAGATGQNTDETAPAQVAGGRDENRERA